MLVSLIAGGALALAASACGIAGSGGPMGIRVRARTRFETEWRRYLERPEAKALAVAGDLRGRYVSGIAHGEDSLEAAARRALARCEVRRAERRIVGACRAYAHGDEIAPAGND
jgi:hypothetical protein